MFSWEVSGMSKGAIFTKNLRKLILYTFNLTDEIIYFQRLLSLQPYGSRDFEIGSCRQHGFFILLQ